MKKNLKKVIRYSHFTITKLNGIINNVTISHSTIDDIDIIRI